MLSKRKEEDSKLVFVYIMICLHFDLFTFLFLKIKNKKGSAEDSAKHSGPERSLQNIL